MEDNKGTVQNIVNRLQVVKLGGTEKTHECEKCNDEEGYIVIVEPDGLDGYKRPYEYWQVCECTKRKSLQRMLKSSQMSEWMQQCTFAGFVTENRPQAVVDAANCALDYYKQFKFNKDKAQNSIALLGKPGSGKTHLLSAVANSLVLKQGMRVLYFPHVEGMEELKEDFEKMPEKVHAMKTVDVLYWDDLFKGRTSPTSWQLEKLFEIVNYRYLNNLPMLISSERTIDDLLEIDEGIGSRIYSMCKNHIVTMATTQEETKTGVKLNYRLI